MHTDRPSPRPHQVAALVTHGVSPFELGVACEVFGLDRSELVDPWYAFRVCSLVPSPVRAKNATGFGLDTPYRLEDAAGADTVVIPMWQADDVPDPEVVEVLRAAHERGARLVSFCSGAFLLAYAGLLDGRRAATHWMFADRLAGEFPGIRVESDVLYVVDGTLHTSAGTAAAIDLCLHIVRTDHGADVANAVARRMVVPPHRDGGQAQFIEAPVPESSGAPDLFKATLDWALAHLDEPLTVATLAARAAMSQRTFARRFVGATGVTPLQWLLRQRVLLAQRLLETTDLPVERVAAECGFGSAAGLRVHFSRHVGTSPAAYRRTFQGADVDDRAS